MICNSSSAAGWCSANPDGHILPLCLFTICFGVGRVNLPFCHAQYEHYSCACCRSCYLCLFLILCMPLVSPVTGLFNDKVSGANQCINNGAAGRENLVEELSTPSCWTDGGVGGSLANFPRTSPSSPEWWGRLLWFSPGKWYHDVPVVSASPLVPIECTLSRAALHCIATCLWTWQVCLCLGLFAFSPMWGRTEREPARVLAVCPRSLVPSARSLILSCAVIPNSFLAEESSEAPSCLLVVQGCDPVLQHRIDSSWMIFLPLPVP